MILQSKLLCKITGRHGTAKAVGPIASLVVFAWVLALILFAPLHKMLWAAGLCFFVAGMLYPKALLHIFRVRWLLLLSLLLLMSLVTARPDSFWLGIAFSKEGLDSGLQMALRAAVIIVALDSLSSTVDISMMAGLLERLGLRGLGFATGVAMNLLPDLYQSFVTTWHALWMRGGLRRQRWRALIYFFTTTLSNALRHAEEIALAAEARAYSPEHSRMQPVVIGIFDIPIIALLVFSLLLFFLL